ncbi:hypothetical protein VSX64_23470 [Aurantimonas sp. C2-6-R+9]|uniref:hypothetical protein n=1 Tax=unclassified Aurantimonas TaxID=2638230 RepID=UPI002E18700B|nr:hypothetical protein [Aurantimonas sp. C2-6-R+9]
MSSKSNLKTRLAPVAVPSQEPERKALAKVPAASENGGKQPGVTTLVCDANDPHKIYGGTVSPAFNLAVVNQAINATWLGTGTSDETRQMVVGSAAGAMMSIEPKDAIEGMLAAQMVATHNAAMECYRRAMIPEQTLVGREAALGQANKLTRSYATLVQAFDKHRGRGQQTVRVEHVHVHDGGQAIVGNVSHGDRMHAEKALHPGVLTPGGCE